MKRVDLHIHTIPTISDSYFEFDINILRKYVDKFKIDVIAITNHNCFDIYQYKDIVEKLADINVFPGIEINIGRYSSGHMLLISDNDDLDDFYNKAKKVSDLIEDANDYIKIDDLRLIFGDLSRYLLIPHGTKKPSFDRGLIKELENYIFCEEVASVKDFMYKCKSTTTLTPLYFSDFRAKKGISEFPSRQTFIDLNEISLKSLKSALLNKKSVALSENEGNSVFQILDNLKISTGLNVIIGERASGKSYTLDRIFKSSGEDENIKYIRQFELLEKDPEKAAKSFEDSLSNKRSDEAQKYLKEFSDVVEDVVDISLEDDNKSIDKYLSSLKKYVLEQERQDIYSKCKIFSETNFQVNDTKTIEKIIDSIITLLEPSGYEEIISKYINKDNLKILLLDLIAKYNKEKIIAFEKERCNDLIEEIQNKLERKTAASKVKRADFFQVALNKRKVERFNKLVSALKYPKIINEQIIEGFKLVTSVEPYQNAQSLKNHSRRNTSFLEVYKNYEVPYIFLQLLKEKGDIIPKTEYYTYFVEIKHRILNSYGFDVSGGERAEFMLLQKIKDSSNCDMLIIDEPESSFDNIFLKNKVNNLIKDISENMPVIIVTHNSTVGASIQPDYLIHTKRLIGDKKQVEYKVYYGNASDKFLSTLNDEKIENINVTYDCLEAGEDAYNNRRKRYEILKD